jgi:ribosomal protein S11
MSKKKKVTSTKLSKKATWKKKFKTLQLGRSTWTARRPTYSTYPYLLTISSFRRNVFFNLSDFKGQTKICTNAGLKGFSGRAKMDHLVIIKLINDFVQEIGRKGIRSILLKFHHVGQKKYSLKKGIIKALGKYNVRFIGLLTTIGIAFNGSRRKKIRRK